MILLTVDLGCQVFRTHRTKSLVLWKRVDLYHKQAFFLFGQNADADIAVQLILSQQAVCLGNYLGSGCKCLSRGAIKSAVFSIIRCITAYLSVRVVSLKEKQKVIISARSYN
ncbi:MAG: hypothetical protein D3913_14370 [Candidatus Electrothrix sp. LOE1_4_5]|nr:hypothetical protein [Candidatus Electrothrix gigas]